MTHKLLLLGLVLGLSACTAEVGPEGPRGEPGPLGAQGPVGAQGGIGAQGPAGAPGNANVKMYDFEIAASQWGVPLGPGERWFRPPNDAFEGASLSHWFNEGANISVYATVERSPEPVPYVYSVGYAETAGSYAGHITVDFEYSAIVITRLVEGTNRRAMSVEQLPAKTLVRIVVTYPPSS